MPFNFEDELQEIFQRQRIKNEEGIDEEAFSPEMIREVFAKLRHPDSYGYLVYLTPDEEGNIQNGLLAMGGYDPRNLSHAHRIANNLIDMILHHDCDEDVDE
jgi:hypothetical protein